MKNLVLYIHGKNGSAEESEHYKKFFPKSEVVGFDYKSQNAWDAKKEFQNFFDSFCENYQSVKIIANSIGAFFVMHALSDKKIDEAFFISPIVNLEKLIADMMTWANVTENELHDKKEIATDFGENLSWKYLCYVRENPIKWSVPTHILYGEKDNLTSLETMKDFAEKIGATLTVMNGGEHFFHTAEQMKFLDNWLENL
ncbi:MAG: alpha/beta hydrolase [Selenomonadaceae bacterium]|nr:alpha/beta hydrolase [Selenomonadaceae bacterium]